MNLESAMDTRSIRTRTEPARTRLVLSTLTMAALVVATACGTSAPSATDGAATTAPAASPAPTPAASAQAENPDGDWVGFHGDAARSGHASAGPIGHPMLSWQARASGGVPGVIAIVGDDVFYASGDAVVHAVDRTTGTERWTTRLDGPTQSGPVATDGRLYFVGNDGTPIALDAATGRILWTAATAYPAPSQLASDDSTLYLGTGDGFLVAVDAATGAELWKVQPSPTTMSVHTPAVANGRIFAGTEGGGYVAVDAATHAVLWTGDLEGDVTGTAATAAGLAFIGSLVDAPTGHLRAFDAVSGKLRWTADTPLLQFPTVADDTAYSATQDGLVAALDLATGSARWTTQLSGKVRPMAVAGSILYLGADQEQKVYALDTATGGKLWSFDVDGANDCCIAVAHGSVFVGTLAGSVYAISGDGAAIAPTPVVSAPSAPPLTDSTVAALPATVSWSTDLRDMGFGPISQIAIDRQGRIWAPEAEGDHVAIHDPSGSLLEEWGGPGTGPGQFDFTRQNGDGYGTLAFAKDGSFYVLDVGNRRVQRFDANRQYLGEWGGFGNDPGQYNDPVGIGVARDGSVWVIDNRRSVVEHYDATGKVLGSFDPFADDPAPDGANSLAVGPTGELYVSLASPSKILVFAPSGTLLRVVGTDDFAEQATHMAVDATGRLYVTQGPERGNAPGVLVFDPDGTLLGGFGSLGDGDGQMVFPAGIALDKDGGLIVEDSLPESARLIRYELEG
jgi:outer membrane protein assembly factor BamB